MWQILLFPGQGSKGSSHPWWAQKKAPDVVKPKRDLLSLLMAPNVIVVTSITASSSCDSGDCNM